MNPGQPRPRRIRSEELHDLLLGGPRPRVPPGTQPADQLQVVQVARGKLVQPALAIEGEHLKGPRADPPDRPQAPPSGLVVGAVQIDPPERDFARDLDQGHGASVREPEGAQTGRRGTGQDLGARRVPETGLSAAAAEDGDYPALDRRGFSDRDQLLADRPGESLEGLRLTANPKPGT